VTLFLRGWVTVSAAGAVALPPTPVVYNPGTDMFVFLLPTAPRQPGRVTITIAITYPGAPT
jgi:hypothetical protein